MHKMRLKFFCALSVACFSAVLPYCFAQDLDPSRRINWNPGVRGGIPTNYGPDCNSNALASTFSASAIQSALNACKPAATATCLQDLSCAPRVLKLSAGTFNINAELKIPSFVVLRGAGMGQTELLGVSPFSGDTMLRFDNGFDGSWKSGDIGLVSPQKNDNTITTSGAHGFEPNDVVLIDMTEDPTGDPAVDITGRDKAGNPKNCTWCGRPNRNIGQWVKILTVPSTTTATIDPPLYWSYNKAPVVVRMSGSKPTDGITHFAGAEDLTLNNLVSKAQDTVGIFGAVNSWLNRVELRGNKRRAIWGYGALWFTIQGCKIWGGVPIPEKIGSSGKYDYVGKDYDTTGDPSDGEYTSDRAYGIFLGTHFSAGLITDSIFEKLTMAVAWEGAISGNVVSYNYMGEMWWEDTDGDYPYRFGPLMHGGHPMMNLVEGNHSIERFRADTYWGTSSHFTLLRNKFALRNRENSQIRGTNCSQAWLVDIERTNRYYSFLGNILGTAGNETEYELYREATSYSCNILAGSRGIFKLGYGFLGESVNSWYDNEVRCTAYRCKNWVSERKNEDPNSDYLVSTTGPGIEEIKASIVCNDVSGRPIINTCASDTVVPNSYYLGNTRPTWFKNPANNQDLRWPPFKAEDAIRECPIPALLRFNPSITVQSGCLDSSSGAGAPGAPSSVVVN